MKPIQAPASLRWWFWAGAAAFLGYEIIAAPVDDPSLLVAGNAVAVLTLLPAGLWCMRRVYGLPIFPLLALSYLPAFAVPLISPTTEVMRYSVPVRLAAAGAVIAFLAVGTLLWYSIASRVSVPQRYWGFRNSDRSHVFLAFLWIGDAWLLLSSAGWLPEMSFAVYSALRNATQGLAILGAAVLAYRWGAGRLPAWGIGQFVAAIGLFLLLSAAGLLLVAALSSFAIVVSMYALGRGRIPVFVVAAAFLVFSVLHLGKHKMRVEYWTTQTRASLHPLEYPQYFGEWFGFGLGKLTGGDDADQSSSLADRASVLQMLLLVVQKSPSEKPYLEGETYALIPELMIPRFLLSTKGVSHEATFMLSVYYGRQTREETRTTTIGFGHLAEAYANFGWPGVLGLGAFFGLALGAVTRWSAAAPIDSFRGLFSLYVLGLSVQTEHTLGVTAASMSQGTLLLLGLAWALMETKQGGGPQ